MEKKQTAVEWLEEQIQERVIAYDKTGRKMIILIYMADYQQLSEEAKEMEKEQIIDAYASGSNDRLKNRINEQYYKETYAK